MSSLRTAVGILRPAPPFPSIALSMGPNVVGRGRGGVMDPRVSREHAEISVTEDEGELSFSLKCLGALTCVSKGGVVTTLKRDDDAVPITAGDSINLLPKLHRFELEVVGRDAAASPASHASSQPQSVSESQPPAAKRQHLEGGGASGSGGGGGGGGGSSGGVSMASGDATGGGGSGADGADGADGSEDDWLGMVLPLYVQPAKPAAMEGLSALERLATTAHAPSERVLLVTSQLVVAYDVYPKARRHLLILPRSQLSGPGALDSQHLPLVRSMSRLAAWVGDRLREREPGLAPLRAGFHAVPSMRQLHLHLISQDFDSPCLKHKKHFNSFATDFFVPPQTWLAQLQAEGCVAVDVAAEEAKLKRDMACPATGIPLRNIPALKEHLASPEYRRALHPP